MFSIKIVSALYLVFTIFSKEFDSTLKERDAGVAKMIENKSDCIRYGRRNRQMLCNDRILICDGFMR